MDSPGGSPVGVVSTSELLYEERVCEMLCLMRMRLVIDVLVPVIHAAVSVMAFVNTHYESLIVNLIVGSLGFVGTCLSLLASRSRIRSRELRKYVTEYERNRSLLRGNATGVAVPDDSHTL